MLGRAPLDGVVTIVVARTLFEQQKEGRVDLLGRGSGLGLGLGLGLRLRLRLGSASASTAASPALAVGPGKAAQRAPCCPRAPRIDP